MEIVVPGGENEISLCTVSKYSG